MEMIQINVSLREELGSTASGRLRRGGFLPGVVYGAVDSAIPVKVEAQQFRKNITGRKSGQLYTLSSGDKLVDGLMVLIRDSQTLAVNDRLLHVDFLAVTEDHRITVTVPIKIVGECAAVKSGEVLLNQTAYELEVECLPREIPEMIAIDVTSLKEGDSIHAQDVALPAGVKLLSEPEFSIVSALRPKEQEEAVVAEAPLEGAEGAEAASAEEAVGAEPGKPGKAEEPKKAEKKEREKSK